MPVVVQPPGLKQPEAFARDAFARFRLVGAIPFAWCPPLKLGHASFEGQGAGSARGFKEGGDDAVWRRPAENAGML